MAIFHTSRRQLLMVGFFFRGTQEDKINMGLERASSAGKISVTLTVNLLSCPRWPNALLYYVLNRIIVLCSMSLVPQLDFKVQVANLELRSI